MRDHRDIDARSLALGQAIAVHLRNDPTLINLAKDNIQRWMPTSSPGIQKTLSEWQKALDGPIEGVIALLTTNDENSTRLRQSNPFAGALSNRERNAIFLRFEAYDKAAT